MTDRSYNGSFKFGGDDKNSYLLIESNKGALEVRSKSRILSKDELYTEFGKMGITLPFSIELEHLYS